MPEAIALIVVIARYLEPFSVLSDLSGALESTRATLARIQQVLDAPTRSAGAAALPDPAAAPRITFEDVTFGYGEDPVLDGVGFALEPGTTTAIVGPSGSGKSTILGLIAGLHEPDHGRVLFGDVDLATLDPDARRAAVSMVFQHPYLFDGSLRDNILVGDPAAAPDTLAGATRLARVDELAARLPDGEQTSVGEAGSALSGGERQRVSIARALVKPAPVLLVDEATSALDTENESAVVDALTADLAPPHPGHRRAPAGQHPACRPGAVRRRRPHRRGRHDPRTARRRRPAPPVPGVLEPAARGGRLADHGLIPAIPSANRVD